MGISGQESLPPLAAPARRAVNWRSLTIGTLLSVGLCAAVPYNDYVVANTMLVGSYLPVAVMLAMFVLVAVINGPLHRFVPRHALTTGELGVILAMLLAACGVPGQGLLRSMIPTIAAPPHLGTQDPHFWSAFTSMNLPNWLIPGSNFQAARGSRVIEFFFNHIPDGSAAPYQAWIAPLLGWGIFIAAMLATFLAAAVLITPQWAVNERLAFPLAQLEVALIESPPPGRSLNRLFSNRGFWIAAMIVVILQSLVVLNRYFPKYVPYVPLQYDLRAVMSEQPWSYFSNYVKMSNVYFTFIGVTFFLSTRASFSLWAIFLITEIINVQAKRYQSEISPGAWFDQAFGASVAFLAGVMWIGRQYWWKLIRGFAGRGDDKMPRHRLAISIVLLGPIVMVVWLVAMGTQAWAAVAIVAIVLMAHLVVARVVAETGLVFIRNYASPWQLFSTMSPKLFRANDIFFAGLWQINGTQTTRESLLPFSMHALRVNDSVETRAGWRLIAAMGWAVALGLVAASASYLYCYYHFAMPLGSSGATMLNSPALNDWPRDLLQGPLNQWADGRFADRAYSPWMHFGIGAVVTGLLQAATLRWAAWPLLPVGYLVSSTWYVQLAWFSIFLGWLSKVLIVRFSGARGFERAKPIFFGLIFGEALAAGIWLVVNIVLAMNGADYKIVQFLPY